MDINRLRELAGSPEQVNEYDARKMTNKLHEMMDEGLIDPRAVADAALKYMSEDEVADMAHANEFFYDEPEDDVYDAEADAANASLMYKDEE